MDGIRARWYGQTPAELAQLHFGTAELGNSLRTQRLLRMAGAMLAKPGQPLTQQFPGRTRQTACYRFLSNAKVSAAGILQPHQRMVRAYCRRERSVTLCIQDTMELGYPTHKKKRGLGKISGQSQGILQHSSLACSERGELLGVLDVRYGNRRNLRRKDGTKIHDPTRQQQRAKGKESAFWPEAAESIGNVQGWPGKLVQVADRGADIFAFIARCRARGQGFVVRAQHNRYLTPPKPEQQQRRLWETLEQQPVVARMQVAIAANRGSRPRHRREARQATVAVRRATVVLPVPRNDPRAAQPQRVTAILVQEIEVPEGHQPVEWMLLSSEPAETLEQVLQIVRWYSYRWKIEEWHRVLKEGLGLERSRLDEAEDIKRLAAILCVQAMQLLVLRDLADSERPVVEQAAARRVLPRMYLEVVAFELGCPVERLTGKQFWRAVAIRGGWPGNPAAPRPGWITLWRGWREIALIADTLARMAHAKGVEE